MKNQERSFINFVYNNFEVVLISLIMLITLIGSIYFTWQENKPNEVGIAQENITFKETVNGTIPVYIERVWVCDKIYALIKEGLNQTVNYRDDSNCRLVWVHKTEYGKLYESPRELIDKNFKQYTEFEKTDENITYSYEIYNQDYGYDNTAPKKLLDLETGEVKND